VAAERPVRLAVLGAGMIGKRHIEHIQGESGAALIAIADPSPEAKAFAEAMGAPWYADFAMMLAHGEPDGVIVATPNQMHVANGMRCIEAGIPALIEKPIADDIAEATKLVEAAERAGVPLMVGHHRRHNPIIQ